MNINQLSPIILFVYNRPEHTKKTVEALQDNHLANQSQLFIYSDGAKKESDLEKINELRAYLKTISGFKKVTIIEQENNLGLANSIISGVTKIVNEFGKIIVLEDDLVTSPYFLQYMNDGLSFYENEKKVISIHGYIYPVKSELPETFFIKGADCWGWATWKRGWDLFNPNGSELLEKLNSKKLTDKFDFDGSYPYTKMLEDQINGKNNSWAIRWYASAYLQDKLTLYPGKSLIENIGLDGSGTHGDDMETSDIKLYQEKIAIKNISIEENELARKSIKKFLKPSRNLFSKIKNKIRKKLAKRKNKKEKYGWFQTDLTWPEAKKLTSGYDSEAILEKCKDALLQVKNGQRAYERDSFLFDKIQYSWQLLSGLLWIAARNEGKLNILDFGGSLGSSYFQNLRFLSQLKKLNWNIVEQKEFVYCGQKYFQNEQLKFYLNIDSCLKEQNPDVILFSSVIQYLPDPDQFLNDVLKYNFKYLILDLTGFVNDGQDILTIQKVPPQIYNASYPCWFFDKEKLFKILQSRYNLIEEFESYIESIIYIDGVPKAGYKGAIFEIKNEKN